MIASQKHAIDRGHVTRLAKNVVQRLMLLAALAVAVIWLQSWLGNLGDILVSFFLALSAVFLVRCGYALLLGLVALMSKLFTRQAGAPETSWLIAASLINALEAAACIGLALYVMRAAGWWTEIQVPVVDDYGQPHF